MKGETRTIRAKNMPLEYLCCRANAGPQRPEWADCVPLLGPLCCYSPRREFEDER